MTDPALQKEFWNALGRGDPARLRELVAEGANVNRVIGNSGGETPLIRAVAAGDLRMVKLLLELGADVNLACAEGRSWTPLMYAHDNPELLRELLAAGAKVNAQSGSDWSRGPMGGMALRPGGETALHLAAASGNADSVRTLLRAGAEVEARAGDGGAPLDYAIRQGNITKAAEALVEAGAELTPQRLELMHASAHRPDSDLLTFSPATERDTTSSADQGAGLTSRVALPGQAPETSKPPEEWRCPTCHALIYSRKPKVCGHCGALLPRELTLTDREASALHEQRRWARDLADKFVGLDPALRVPASSSGERSRKGGVAQRLSPEELARSVSCVEAFKRRDRPAFWLHVVGYGFALSVCAFIAIQLDVLVPELLPTTIVLFLVLCVFAWFRASPVCPNCGQNIRYCAASYCHVCSTPLKYGRCEDCGVDESWPRRLLRQYGPGGSYRWIRFCPGCGVEVGSKVVRWLAD